MPCSTRTLQGTTWHNRKSHFGSGASAKVTQTLLQKNRCLVGPGSHGNHVHFRPVLLSTGSGSALLWVHVGKTLKEWRQLGDCYNLCVVSLDHPSLTAFCRPWNCRCSSSFLACCIAKSFSENQEHHHVGHSFAVETSVCHAETGGARPGDDLFGVGHALFRHTRAAGVGGSRAGPMAMALAGRGCGGDFGSSPKCFHACASYAEPDFARECFVDLL